MKILSLIIFLLFSQSLFSESVVDVTGRVTLKEAIALGAKAEVDKGRFGISYKVNFDAFKVCIPEYVNAQAFDAEGNVQLSAKLASDNGWYEFSIGLKDKPNNRINIWCKTGDRNLYFISL